MSPQRQDLSPVRVCAALLGGQGRVSAFDMNERRLSRLEGNAQATGATNVVAQQVRPPQGFVTQGFCGQSVRPPWGCRVEERLNGSTCLRD